MYVAFSAPLLVQVIAGVPLLVITPVIRCVVPLKLNRPAMRVPHHVVIQFGPTGMPVTPLIFGLTAVAVLPTTHHSVSLLIAASTPYMKSGVLPVFFVPLLLSPHL